MNGNFTRNSNMLSKKIFKIPSRIYIEKKGYKPSIFMKISKSALDKILSLFVPVNRAQILYKTMKKPTVMLLFSGSCCERVVPMDTFCLPHHYVL